MVLFFFDFVICWSWDNPIIMRFLCICFDHFFVFFSLFLAAHSLYESSKRFYWKLLKSIQKLTNCAVKGWLIVQVIWIQTKKNCTTEFKGICIACSRRILFEAFCFWENGKKTKKKSLQSDWFWNLCCHISLFLHHMRFTVMLFLSLTHFCLYSCHYFELLVVIIDINSVLSNGKFLPVCFIMFLQPLKMLYYQIASYCFITFRLIW